MIKRNKRIPYRRELDASGYRERRGIRDFSIPFGCDAAGPPAEMMRKARQLGYAACRLLDAVGEPKLNEVLASADAATVEDERAAKAGALANWYGEIATRHGVLSPVALAAKFLAMEVVALDIAADGVDLESPNAQSDLDSRFHRLMAFCDAWHWFHMEVYGEHAKAFEGKRTEDNLRASGERRAARKAERKAVIAEWCRQHWVRKPSHKANASQTAAAILRDVNAALKHADHAGYKSERTLALVVGEIIREHKRCGS